MTEANQHCCKVKGGIVSSEFYISEGPRGVAIGNCTMRGGSLEDRRQKYDSESLQFQ
jgi:hypothetical protein